MINNILGQTTKSLNNSILSKNTSIASEYFSKIYGNSGNNAFTKAVSTSDHYYIIGKNDDKATVTKIDIMGNLVWSRVTDDMATWNDIAINKDGNFILSGHFGSLNDQAKSLIGVINSNTGTFISLKHYDIKVNGRESLKCIYKNPAPLNSNFPYYVSGFMTNSGNEDDVMLVNLDDNGAVNFVKKYTDSDDEFFQGITVDGRFGEMMLYGARFSDGTQGTTVSIDKSGDVLSGRLFNTDLYFFCHLSNTNPTVGFNHILGGSTGNKSRARIVKVNGNAVVYNYDINQINNISHLYAIPSSQSFIAIGTGNFGGVNKSVLMHFTENGNSLNLNWAKLYETTETAISDGFGRFVANNKFLYLDARINHRNTLGNSDGFLTITEANFENCIDNNITLNITPIVDIFNEFAPTVSDVVIPTGTNTTSNTIVYSDADICQLPCNISFSQTLDKCGKVDFVSQTNLTGNVTYNWAFGTNPQTNSTQQNPSHTYLANGNYNVCVTVSNGTTSCNICKNVLVNNADIQKPIINCPTSTTLTTEPNMCFTRYAPLISITDDCDNNPIYICTMTGATNGNLPINTLAQFNLGTTTVNLHSN